MHSFVNNERSFNVDKLLHIFWKKVWGFYFFVMHICTKSQQENNNPQAFKDVEEWWIWMVDIMIWRLNAIHP